jgi:hypothetical protein
VPDALAGRLREIQQSLVRKDLVRPTGEDTFRFKHLLLRDAAYAALPKEQRADLHERLAEWLAAKAPDQPELRGYHLEQAYRYRTELGPVDEDARQLAQRAAALLAEAGRRARDRADVHATTNLLERAVRLLPEGHREAIALYPDLASALEEGGDLEQAEQLYRVAEEQGNEATVLRARLRLIWFEVMRGASMAETVGPMEATVAEAERLGDKALLAEALRRLGVLSGWLGDRERAAQLLRSSLEHAESIGDPQERSLAVQWIALGALWGPTPVDLALEECRRLAQSTELGQSLLAELRVVEGTLRALAGDFERGRQLSAEARRDMLELGRRVQYAAIAQPAAIIELLADDAPAAERILREAREILAAAGERGFLSTVSALLALAVARQERYAEAETFADESKEIGAEDDAVTQIYWRVAKANVLAARGEQTEAARLATEVMELTAGYASFDGPIVAVEVVAFLEPDARRAALERALAGAEAQGNTVTAQQAREMLAALP